MFKLYPNTTRGILNPHLAAQKFHIQRYSPSADLAHFIERYWAIQWDLRGEAPYLQELLPYPCVNMVIERGQSGVFGVITGKSGHLIEDEGRVLGIKFKPGGFYPFWQRSVAELTNHSVKLEDVFGADATPLEAAVLAGADDAGMIAPLEAFLRERLPAPDGVITEINRIVDLIIADRTITRVEDVALQSHVSKRTLQRLFRHYVGVPPKWVIQRYRLHEVAEQLAEGSVTDWAGLAVKLGYFDQAHFIKDFKMIVGVPPTEYIRQHRDAL